MTNKINKCDGNHGGPRCADPECWNDAPVPPTGGDVEVLGYWCVSKEAPLQGRYIEARHADLEAGGFSESFAAVFNVTELVDRAHVTQLKAEVTEQALCAASEARRALRAESELAKARELIGDLRADTQSGYLKAVQALHNWANQPAPRGYSNIVMTGTSCNQSAPADKVHGVPVDVEAEMLKAFSTHAKQFTYKNHPATPSMFPVGFPWFKAGYELGRAERPAPVAVVMPELVPTFEAWWESDGQYCRAGGGDYEKTFAYRAYENALAEIASLNPIKQ